MARVKREIIVGDIIRLDSEFGWTNFGLIIGSKDDIDLAVPRKIYTVLWHGTAHIDDRFSTWTAKAVCKYGKKNKVI
jgi:hypothetical protein